MGYTFLVGNACAPVNDAGVDESDEDYRDPKDFSTWRVEWLELPDAPAFPNDFRPRCNERSPSYSAWSAFCKETGLTDYFYDARGHLRAGHPGCVRITINDVNLVTAALEAYRLKTTRQPGFAAEGEDDTVYDYQLARLMWLHWWMVWAVENCENPAIQNW